MHFFLGGGGGEMPKGSEYQIGQLLPWSPEEEEGEGKEGSSVRQRDSLGAGSADEICVICTFSLICGQGHR